MRRDRPTTPFDIEADEASDITRQFWGTTRGWVSREHPTVDHGSERTPVRDDTTGSLRAIRDGLEAFRPRRSESRRYTDGMTRTRQHGVVSATSRRAAVPEPDREATLGELADGAANAALHDGFDESYDSRYDGRDVADPIGDEELIPLTPNDTLVERLGLGAVDPLLVRFGAILLVGVLMIPLALALRGGDDDAVQSEIPGAGQAPIEQAVATEPVGVDSDRSTGAESSGAVTSPAVVEPVASGEPATAATDAAPIEATAPAEAAAESSERALIESVESDSRESTPDAVVEAATASEDAERLVPVCPTTYEAGAGDSWYRIAEEAGVTRDALLAENRSTLGSTILPGDDICLPGGASMPTQLTAPTSAAAAAAPTTTDAPATTAAPTTTEAPAPAPAPAPSASAAAQIIRDVWPDELEERALEIAWRESRHQADADNGWCCYGLFQIHWTAHDDWLDDHGIHQVSDLFDARKNAEAAYALYTAAGGWGPWGG